MTISNIIATVLMMTGLIFMAIAALGIFKFPDFYTRLHAAGVGDTLALLLILFGMVVVCGFKLLSLKLLLIFGLLILTNPVGTNLITMVGVHFHNYQNYNSKARITDEDKEEGR